MARTWRTFAGIIAASVLIIIAALIVVSMFDIRRGRAVSAEVTSVAEAVNIQAATLTALVVNTPRPTITPSPEPTATPIREATVVAEATAIADETAALLETAVTWPLVFSDSFDNNDAAWGIDGGNTSMGVGQRGVVEGQYVWDFEAVSGFSWATAPTDTYKFDSDFFYVAVDVDIDNDNNGSANLAYRHTDRSNYYQFGLCDEPGHYHVWARQNAEWRLILACTPSDTILRNQPNRLAVVGDGDRHSFYINDQFVYTVRESQISGGGFGVMVNLAEGQRNIFRFDNFELRTP